VTRPELNAEPETPTVTRPERDAASAQVTAPTSEAPPSAATEVVIEQEDSSAEQAAPVQEALGDPQPRAAPTKAAPKASTPRVQHPVDEEERAPLPGPGHQKPPDLVTKW
jgi:hypothetical protein